MLEKFCAEWAVERASTFPAASIVHASRTILFITNFALLQWVFPTRSTATVACSQDSFMTITADQNAVAHTESLDELCS